MWAERPRPRLGGGARRAGREVGGHSGVQTASSGRVPRGWKKPRPIRPGTRSPQPLCPGREATSGKSPRHSRPAARCHGDFALANHMPARQVLPPPPPPRPLRTTFPVRPSKQGRARPPPADAHFQRPLQAPFYGLGFNTYGSVCLLLCFMLS